MTITRLWQSGFEANGTTLLEFSSTSSTPPSISTTARTGTYSMAHNSSSRYIAIAMPASLRQIRCGFWWKCDTLKVGNITIWQIRSSSGSSLADLRTESNGSLSLYVAGTLRASMAGFYPTDWKHVAIDLKINSSAGWVTVYLNGTQAASYGGNTGNSDVFDVVLGNNTGNGAGSTWEYFDDALIDNTTGEASATPVPDRRFEYITPNGNGNYSQCAGSDGNSTDNYLLVDERPHDGDTTFCEADTLDERDTYAMTTITLPSGWTIAALIPTVVGKKSDSDTDTEIALTTRYAGTDQDGTARDLPGSYGIIWDRFTAKPGGGAFDQASLDGIEVGWIGKGTF